MSEKFDEMFEQVYDEYMEKRRRTEQIRAPKTAQITPDMLEQIEKEVQGFDTLSEPTEQQKYEQACRLATLLSYHNRQMFDVKMYTTANMDGIVELWCDKTVFMFPKDILFWCKLNELSEQTCISYSKDAFKGGEIIKFIFTIPNVRKK